MVLPHSPGDLYHKYRPRRFSEITGHKEVVSSLKKAITSNSPSQVFMLTGDSGTGKTSSARIVALSLNCLNKEADGEPCLECPSCKVIVGGNCMDLLELNAADHRGIDAVRDIASKMSLMPMQLKNKVYILDEAQQLTKEAQSSLLKVLEETPKRVFIILCTTNPEKILPTVKNRCQIFRFKNLSTREIESLLEEVCTYEGANLSKDIINLIASSSGGSPRNSLVRLQQVLQLGSSKKEEIARLLEAEDAGGEDIFRFFLQLSAKRTSWKSVMEAYHGVKDMGPTAIGMSLAGLFRNKLISETNQAEEQMYYHRCLELFLAPFDEGKLGENQLIAALYRAAAR